MSDRLNDPTAHDLPTSEELAERQPGVAAAAAAGERARVASKPIPPQHTPRTERERRILAGVRMIATLGHSCGLVDPYGYGPEPGASYSPIRGILDYLAEAQPWLLNTWEYRQALERTEGRR